MSKNLKDDILFSGNAVFIEQMYEIYLTDSNKLDKSWLDFFQQFYDPNGSVAVKTTAKVMLPEDNKISPALIDSINSSIDYNILSEQIINAYRNKGHYLVSLDPLGIEKIPTKEELGLDKASFSLNDKILDLPIEIESKVYANNISSLNKLIDNLDKTYTNDIAIEVKHIESFPEYNWLCNSFEHIQQNFHFASAEKKEILASLIKTESFEQYLHTKFPGAKRFSIEGGESYVVALDYLINIVADNGFIEVVIGMAHRGRLSTLVQVMGKDYSALFAEFLGASAFPTCYDIAGDVKYHMGYESKKATIQGNKISLTLAPNPSHLEAVNTVVTGKVRAKQDIFNDVERNKILGILVHGDAAFCGQGIVAEGFAMSVLAPYNVGGVIHFVINNQVGFTANSSDGHVGRYATDIAKVINAPILHVNGDNIEAVLKATYVAMNYRNKFGKDVVIDIICYRKYGHNEGDEPMYTQAFMYNIIKNKQSPANIYCNMLKMKGVISDIEIEQIKSEFKAKLDTEFTLSKDYQPTDNWFQGLWNGYQRQFIANIETGVEVNKLRKLGLKLCDIPSEFPLNTKLRKLFEQRKEFLISGKEIDWATAEQLAFASLLVESVPVRITGQDSGRGTFSHRHSVLHSQIDHSKYIPLNNLAENQAKYFVADSNLSEYGVLGFEYGYSTVDPKHLVIWEAQFGDFANGAQIIFDQFLSASESKWLEISGLVILLPHGFEGQGPEHSSARLERFLTLAAEGNMRICYPTTPASLFHLLRSQVCGNVRKPLVVMSPKSLLRHKLVISNLEELGMNTRFTPIIDEVDNISQAKITRIILCSGKVYYDLYEGRNKNNIENTAIIRFEQLYPFDNEYLAKILSQYTCAKEFIWCQEEPKNMGAWNFINAQINDELTKINELYKLEYVGRKTASSPAVGYLAVHNKEQQQIVNLALKVK